MLSERCLRSGSVQERTVLILVLMENALRESLNRAGHQENYVLILVLMENALRAYDLTHIEINKPNVLILVLMENALRDFGSKVFVLK